MSLVTMREMLKEARAHKYAVGAFEFWSYDSAYAVAKAAKSLNVPAILQVGPYEKEFMDGYKNAVAMAKMASEHFDLPVAIHLDHAEEYDEVVEALEAGFTSVMIDASKYEFDKNVELTCKVVEKAKEYGGKLHMKGRIITPEEIANVIYLLSLEEAAAINGTTVAADDGYTAFKGVNMKPQILAD